jgi:hypothetical protein
MALSFKPKGEDELQTRDLLQPGEYDFEVLAAEHAVSKKTGNPMIKLKLGVWRPNGSQQFVWDYLIASMEAKLRHFCDTTGLLPKYQAGTLAPEDCVGRSGKVKIAISKDKDGQYPPKNEAKDYVCRPAKAIAPPQPQPSNSHAIEDDVPF